MRQYQLDGLRAVAVILVLLFHHGLVRSGWIGVDIFFVLSGFLITGILRREVNDPNYWRSFYMKRATRIMPPLVAVFVAAYFLAGHFKLVYFGYLLFASNIIQLTSAALGSLGALWSLAIEEHFYFLWPQAVKRLNREHLLALSSGIVLLSPLVRIIATLVLHHFRGPDHDWNSPIFLFTPFRIDGLAAGAYLALLVEDRRRPLFLERWSASASIAAATLFCGLELFFKSFRRTADSFVFNGFGYSLVVLASFFLVAFLVLKPNSLVSKLLSSSTLVYVGTISYGIYLFQEPAKYITRSLIGAAAPRLFLLSSDLAITTAIATASFYFYERPIMGWGKRWLSKSATGSRRRGRQEVVPMALQPTENA
jgi:peptidoglycan/LPS O-acetylase OafA/YrhL